MVRCATELGLSSDCGWVDCVQWPAALTQWDTVSYVYDPAGRRIAKAYDGQAVMKYLYDGDHIIAEYDATGALVHKYIYGPGVDQPLCMIDVSGANAAYYYHFDGLGSVIALTDSAGAVANLYEYSIFGEVSASDPNHPNRFLFTGREFDSETGLYYYRARYYNPYIGRFLQTDPIGYADGMNTYAYCRNDPVGLVDPSGTKLTYTVARSPIEGAGIRTVISGTNLYGDLVYWEGDIGTWDGWVKFMADTASQGLLWFKPDETYAGGTMTEMGKYADDVACRQAFWTVRALIHLGILTEDEISLMECTGVTIDVRGQVWVNTADAPYKVGASNYDPSNGVVAWSWKIANSSDATLAENPWVRVLSPISLMAHELTHALDHRVLGNMPQQASNEQRQWLESRAITMQNRTTTSMFQWNPGMYEWLWNGVNPIRPDWTRLNIPVGPPPARLPKAPWL